MTARRPTVPLILPAAAAYIATVVVLIGNQPTGWEDAFRTVFRTAESVVWCSLVGAQAALWAGVMMPVSGRLFDDRKVVRDHWLYLLLTLIGMVALFWLFMKSHQLVHPAGTRYPVVDQQFKVRWITGIGFFIVLAPSLLGLTIVGLKARQLDTSKTNPDRSKSIIALADELRWYLLIVSIGVGAATLSTGALNHALPVLNPGEFKFKASIVLLYGAFGSGIVALVYLPAYNAVRSAAVDVLNTLSPLDQSGAAELIASQETRAKVLAALAVAPTASGAMKAGAAVLAPLVGSVVSLLIGIKE